MSKIQALNSKGVNPAVLLQEIAEDIENTKSLFVVALDHSGEPHIYSVGDLGSLSFAIVCLQDLAMKFLNGMELEG